MIAIEFTSSVGATCEAVDTELILMILLLVAARELTLAGLDTPLISVLTNDSSVLISELELTPVRGTPIDIGVRVTSDSTFSSNTPSTTGLISKLVLMLDKGDPTPVLT